MHLKSRQKISNKMKRYIITVQFFTAFKVILAKKIDFCYKAALPLN